MSTTATDVFSRGVRRNYADGADTFVAITCAVHCAAGAVLPTLLALLGIHVVNDSRVEYALVASALVIGVVSLGRGYRVHRKARPWQYFALGLSLVVLSHVVERSSEPAAIVCVIVGAGCVIAAHLLNARLQRRCAHAACE